MPGGLLGVPTEVTCYCLTLACFIERGICPAGEGGEMLDNVAILSLLFAEGEV